MGKLRAPSAVLIVVLAITGGACGGDDGDAAATTTVATPATGATTSTTAPELAPLAVSAAKYVELFNAQLPRVAAESLDLQLDPVADGVYGGLINLVSQVLVFADSPTDQVRAVSVLIDTEASSGQLPTRLIGTAGSFLGDDPAGTLEAFNEDVVPTLDEISEAREEFHLGSLDLILTVEGPVVVFTYLAPGGELPAFLTD
jgi:hypothetical protein